MVNGNCAFVGCTNSNYRLKLWRKKPCEIHVGMTHNDCPCPQPFRLRSFPSKMRFSATRDDWIRAINRVTKRKTKWQPGSSDTVCSKHFIEGAPTALNPIPTLKLGYEKPAKKPRRELFRNVASDVGDEEMISDCGSTQSNPVDCDNGADQTAVSSKCESCVNKDILVDSIQGEVDKIKEEKAAIDTINERLSKEVESLKIKNSAGGGFSFKDIKKDADMIFYTGLST